MHEGQFPNVGFLKKQFFGISGWQIKTKWVFSLVGVLTALRRCRLQVENMDQIFIKVKNWLDNSHLNYKPNSNFKQYLKVEEFLVEENYNLIDNIIFLKNWRLIVINFVGLGWVCVLCGVWVR
jgi:hypothetical protein